MTWPSECKLGALPQEPACLPDVTQNVIEWVGSPAACVGQQQELATPGGGASSPAKRRRRLASMDCAVQNSTRLVPDKMSRRKLFMKKEWSSCPQLPFLVNDTEKEEFSPANGLRCPSPRNGRHNSMDANQTTADCDATVDGLAPLASGEFSLLRGDFQCSTMVYGTAMPPT